MSDLALLASRHSNRKRDAFASLFPVSPRALDALTRIGMQSLLECVWLEQGFTAILVTHDVAEALTLADRVVLIESGRIALDLPIPFARPRRRGAVQFGELEEYLLTTLLKSKSHSEEYVI